MKVKLSFVIMYLTFSYLSDELVFVLFVYLIILSFNIVLNKISFAVKKLVAFLSKRYFFVIAQ